MGVDALLSEGHDFVCTDELSHGASTDDVGHLAQNLIVGHD
jgi:hypothetical protein